MVPRQLPEKVAGTSGDRTPPAEKEQANRFADARNQGQVAGGSGPEDVEARRAPSSNHVCGDLTRGEESDLKVIGGDAGDRSPAKQAGGYPSRSAQLNCGQKGR